MKKNIVLLMLALSVGSLSQAGDNSGNSLYSGIFCVSKYVLGCAAGVVGLICLRSYNKPVVKDQPGFEFAAASAYSFKFNASKHANINKRLPIMNQIFVPVDEKQRPDRSHFRKECAITDVSLADLQKVAKDLSQSRKTNSITFVSSIRF